MTTADTAQLLPQLRASPLFAGIADDVLLDLLPHLHRHTWGKRQQIMPATQTAKRFYLLTAGRVRIEAEHPESGRAITLCLLGPGDGHNLVTLLDGKAETVMAETLDETTALYAPLDLWRQWLDDYPDLRHAAMRYAAARLRGLHELAEDLALHDTSARLAHLLLRHLDNEPNLDNLVHEDLGRMIGSVRVVVNRLLNRFRHEGIIETEAGQLRVTDLERLLHKAERRISDLCHGNDRTP
ncbi:Crp/Fnr family transcriptional regulator [Acidihalobacter ferrooxydans]|uniref:Crp/Fnr family transcriptional regulator n=1 Tax=Acidihalobacter ferrooxydans TaxID=1765967 RepID=A0A1P8UF29_9GAMM|nr:Crp/Fnr family transcriptional regulator [Acidihalobacter ferrooxydans]APZ42450.1 hypothetical protein BW247_04560 [Acidihalobacter ferrooxydans]